MSKINVKQVDLTHRYKDNDILVAPTTVLDQVKINDTELPDGTIVEGIEKTPAYIYNGKIPKNLNEALKNLAENVKGAVGGQVTALKVGPAGTPIDPDASGIITFPLATDTDNGAINKADIKTMIDSADNARDAKRPTVNNKVMTGVKADGTAEYYDMGTKLTAPGTGKAFAGFTGGDVTQPEWADIKTAVAQKPFTGSITIEGQTYSPDQIGLSTTYIDAVLSNVKIVESDTLTPRADNTYTGVKDDSAKTLTITIPKAEGKVKDVKIGSTSIVGTDGNAVIPVKSTYTATDTDPINAVGVKAAIDAIDVTDTAVDGKYVSKVDQTDGKITVTRESFPEASTTVKGIINTTETYSATDTTKAMTGKAAADMLGGLDVAEVGQAGKYIQKIKEEDGKIVPTLADVKSTFSATDTEPINGVGVNEALKTLDVSEVGEVGKYIQKIKEEDGKITATLAPVKSTFTATDTEPINGVGVNEALKTLDVTDTAVTDQYVSQVSETDGKIAVTRVKLPVKDVKLNGTTVVANEIADLKVATPVETKYVLNDDGTINTPTKIEVSTANAGNLLIGTDVPTIKKYVDDKIEEKMIEAGSGEMNVLESVKVGTTTLPITSKTVTIDLTEVKATGDNGVKATTLDGGKIKVEYDKFVESATTSGTANQYGFFSDTNELTGKILADTYGQTTSGTTTAFDEAAGTYTVPTTKAVHDYLDKVLGGITGAMVFKGGADTIASTTFNDTSVGWTFVAGTAGTYAGIACNPGDMLIVNTVTGTTPSWTKVSATTTVDNKAASIGTTNTTIATVAGTDITAKVDVTPATDDTLNTDDELTLANVAGKDIKVKMKDSSTTFTEGSVTGEGDSKVITWPKLEATNDNGIVKGADVKDIKDYVVDYVKYKMIDAGSGEMNKVDDVKIDGVSVVTNKIADIPLGSTTKYGVAKLDINKIDSASTAKTNDPILMTGKAIEDSLAVKKVNGNASIYAHNASIPAVDNAIALGAGATVSAAGGVAVGAGATTASANDVAIGFGASTASDGSIAIGKSAAARNTTGVALGNSSTAKGSSSVAVGDTADAEGQNAIAIGKEAYVDKAAGIAIGVNTTSNNAGEIALGKYNKSIADTDAQVGTAFTIGDGTNSEAHNLIEQKANADLYVPGIGGYNGKNSDPTDYELDKDGNVKVHPDGYNIKKVKPLQEAIVEDVLIKTQEGSGGGTYASSMAVIQPGSMLGLPSGAWCYVYQIAINDTITITDDISASFSITGNVNPFIVEGAGTIAMIMGATGAGYFASTGTSSFNTTLIPAPDAIGATLSGLVALVLVGDSDSYDLGSATLTIGSGSEEKWETVVDHHIVKLPVDNALDEDSLNPVANKTVTKAFLWKKADEPTSLIAKNMGDATCTGRYSIVAGEDLAVDVDHSLVLGKNNTVDWPSDDSIVLGEDNTVESSGNNIINGTSNTINGAGVNIILGTSNTISGNRNIINGNNNKVDGDHIAKSLVVGDNNTFEGCENFLVAGYGNDFNGTNMYGVVTGHTNKIADNAQYNIVVGNENDAASGQWSLSMGYDNKNTGVGTVAGLPVSAICTSMIGQHLEVSNDFEHARGQYNRTASVTTNNNYICESYGSGVHIPGSDEVRRNLNETWKQGERYILGIGGFDGTNSNPDVYKKNADGTDYVSPLTHDKEHEVKSLQEVITFMEARIKYLEDIIDKITEIHD